MKARRSGSVLLVALAAVAVASTLAVALAAWLRPQLALSARRRESREGIRTSHACIDLFAESVLCVDTNGCDYLGEQWRLPFALGDPPRASLAPEFPDAASDAHPCDDEEGRLPLNSDDVGPLAELIAIVSDDAGRDACQRLAGEILALRPIVRREQIRLAPSMSPETYAALAPFVTAAPVEGINLNTAPKPVLQALFAFAGRFDASAARTLADKIYAFRADGGHFDSAEPAAVNAALGGLAQAEVLLLAAAKGRLRAESRHFSSVAESGPARVVFTYDREGKRLVRVVELR